MREMMKTAKQKLAFLLAVAMVMTSLNFTAFAAEDVSAVDEIAVTEGTEETAQAEAAQTQDVSAQETTEITDAVQEEEASVTASAATLAEELVGADTTTPYDAPTYVPKGDVNYLKAVMNKKGRIKLTWKKMNNSTNYSLYRYVSDYDGKGTEGFKPVFENQKKLSYVDQVYEGNAESFVYKIVAYDNNGKIVEEKTRPNGKVIPAAVTAVCMPLMLKMESSSGPRSEEEGVDDGPVRISLTYTQVKGPHVSYVVTRVGGDPVDVNDTNSTVSPYNGKSIKIMDTPAVTYTDDSTSFVIGNRYKYQVKAVFKAGDVTVESAATAPAGIRAAITKPYLFATFNVSANRVFLAFNRIKGAEYYEVFYSEDEDGVYKKLPNKLFGGKITEQSAINHPYEFPFDFGDDDKWINTSWACYEFPMKPETLYYYRVRAVSNGVAGPMSDADASMTHLEVIDDIIAYNTDEKKMGIELSFAQVPGANRYKVYRSSTGVSGNYTPIMTTTGTKHKNGYVYIADYTKLVPNTTYCYKVEPMIGKKACDHQGGEDVLVPSNEVKCVMEVAKPTLASESLSRIRVKWVPKTGAKYYEIQYCTDGKFGTDAQTITVNKGTDGFNKRYTCITNCNPDYTYYVRMRVYIMKNGEGNYSDWSPASATKTYPAVLTGLNVKWESASRAKITWNRSSEYLVRYYRLQYAKNNSSDYQNLRQLTEGREVYMDVEDGTVYNFRVAGVYRPSSGGERVGKWISKTYAKPAAITLHDISKGGKYEKAKGWSGTIAVDYKNRDGNTFNDQVTEKKVTWECKDAYGNGTGWITAYPKNSDGGDYSGVIKVNPSCPAGTYQIIARAANYTNNNDKLTQYFYITVK